MCILAKSPQFLREDPSLDAVRAEGLREQLPRGRCYCPGHTVSSAVQPRSAAPGLPAGLCPPCLPVLDGDPNYEEPFMPATQSNRCTPAPCRLKTDAGPLFSIRSRGECTKEVPQVGYPPHPVLGPCCSRPGLPTSKTRDDTGILQADGRKGQGVTGRA